MKISYIYNFVIVYCNFSGLSLLCCVGKCNNEEVAMIIDKK